MGFKPLLRSVAALVIASAITACGEKPAAPPAGGAAPLPTVSVATVIYERLTEWDEFVGRLESPENVALRPRVSGYIDKVMFQEGALVKAGDVLFVIDNRPFVAEVKRLEADLAEAKSQADLAKLEYQRAEKLISQNAVSKEEFDSRFTQLESSRSRIKSIEAALELAQLNLSYTQVKAPIDGRASRAIVTKGNFVTAGESSLTSIMSTQKIYAYFDADEQTFLKYVKLLDQTSGRSQNIKPTPVSMALINEDDFPHQGTIDFIDNQVNPDTGTIRMRAVFDNQQGQLLPGLFSRVRLVGSETYDGVLIDDVAIGTDLNNKFVLVLDENNTVQYRAVKTGERIYGLRIIKSGLQKGDKIVVRGLQRVRPGTPVNPEIIDMAPRAIIDKLNVQRLELERFYQEQLALTQKPAVDTNVGG